jgi:hypothetical protein
LAAAVVRARKYSQLAQFRTSNWYPTTGNHMGWAQKRS